MRFLQTGSDNALRFTPVARPLSATLAFLSPSGSTISSPSVALDTFDRTISSVADFSFVVAAGAGTPVAGRSYWVVPTGEEAFLVTISRVAGSTLTYDDLPAGTITVGDTIVGADLIATILTAAVATVGLHNQLRWKVTHADSTERTYLESAAICRTVFNVPVTAAVCAAHVGSRFPGVVSPTNLNSASQWIEIAARASRRVETHIIASGKMPHLIGDQSLLEDAGFTSLQLELANRGLVPTGFDPAAFVANMKEDLDKQLEFALSSIWYDLNQDGAVNTGEVRSPKSIRLVRS